MSVAVEREAPIGFVASLARVVSAEYRDDCTMMLSADVVRQEYRDLFVPLVGKHQEQNVITVLSALIMLEKTSNARFSVSEHAIREGIKRVHEQSGLQARIQCIRQDPPIILDVGHNLAGIYALVATLQASGYRAGVFRIIFGAMRDKPIKEMLAGLEELCRELIAVQPITDRAMSAQDIANLAQVVKIPYVKCIPSIAEAIDVALRDTVPLLIVGSFYVADEAIIALQQRGIMTA